MLWFDQECISAYSRDEVCRKRHELCADGAPRGSCKDGIPFGDGAVEDLEVGSFPFRRWVFKCRLLTSSRVITSLIERISHWLFREADDRSKVNEDLSSNDRFCSVSTDGLLTMCFVTVGASS